jgi:2-dehydro-3-deoxyphosphogluconate aldolase / (4S)-4-hydroxy-2-oxoglutarate aldolase
VLGSRVEAFRAASVKGMTREETRKRILEIGIVPVVRAASAKQALLAAEAVCAGGIPIVEVTMTVPGAVEVIAELARTAAKQLLIGAGTVLHAEAARRCLDAGAQFLVSPGFDLPTLELAHREDKLMMAAGLTPNEVIAAWKAGSDFVKVFPCGSVGGPKYIQALRGPLPQIPLVPTGGVNLSTAADFIRAGSAALGVGGELVHAEALKAGKHEVITENARKLVEIVKQTRAEISH